MPNVFLLLCEGLDFALVGDCCGRAVQGAALPCSRYDIRAQRWAMKLSARVVGKRYRDKQAALA